MDIDETSLKWWKHESTRILLLSQLAKLYLCSCATSVASERTFSTAGNIITSNRSLLKPEKANQLIFIAKNLYFHVSPTFIIPVYHLLLRTWNIKTTFPNHVCITIFTSFSLFSCLFRTCFFKMFELLIDKGF